MATIKKTPPNVSEDMEQLEHSQIAGGSIKWHNHCGKRFSQLLINCI